MSAAVAGPAHPSVQMARLENLKIYHFLQMKNVLKHKLLTKNIQ